MMKLVDASEFDASKKTVVATKLSKDDLVVNISLTDATTTRAEDTNEDMFMPLSGGYDDGMYDMSLESFMDMSDMGGDIIATDTNAEIASDNSSDLSPEETIYTNEIVVLETAMVCSLDFHLGKFQRRKRQP